MFTDVHCPDSLSHEELDDYLRSGWFRMGQTIFTTNFLSIRNEFHSVLWLRIDLNQYAGDRGFEKLSRKNASFSVVFRKASIDTEKEELYQRYRKGIDFEVSASLQELLLRSSQQQSIFDTYEVCLYDRERIIATGFFDLGSRSAAGITSFYDPDYKKYSLGKYLIYLKVNYCQSLGLDFFYPGYFAPDTELFRYKLDIGNAALYFLEFNTHKWVPISQFTRCHDMLRVMHEKLLAVQSTLSSQGIATELFYYEFLSANSLPELMGLELFDFPLFLYCSDLTEKAIQPLVLYEPRNGYYHLINCESTWESGFVSNNKNAYSAHLLKPTAHQFSTPIEQEMITALVAKYRVKEKSS